MNNLKKIEVWNENSVVFGQDVSIEDLAERTNNFSGAEIAVSRTNILSGMEGTDVISNILN